MGTFLSKPAIYILAFTLMAASIFSCTKPTTTAPPVETTKLQIFVMDQSNYNGLPSQNPKVQLFKTNTDRTNKTNPVTDLVTGDANGNVNFDNLEAIDYYFNAYSNDLSMSNAKLGNHTGVLTKSTLNKINTGVK